MIEDHVGMSCVWIACCMIEKICKDCKIELCGLLAHSTVDHLFSLYSSNLLSCQVRYDTFNEEWIIPCVYSTRQDWRPG